MNLVYYLLCDRPTIVITITENPKTPITDVPPLHTGYQKERQSREKNRQIVRQRQTQEWREKQTDSSTETDRRVERKTDR